MNGYQNYLFLPEKNREKPIYRIMPVHRLFDCFANNRLVLVAPKKWDDPFENLFLTSRLLTENGEQGTFGFRDKIFGQCWICHKETDGMWRIYSPNKDGVKVRSTPKKLLEALKKKAPDEGNLSCFVGRVQYQKKSSLIITLEGIKWFNTNGSGIAESLMYKRSEFKHEVDD